MRATKLGRTRYFRKTKTEETQSALNKESRLESLEGVIKNWCKELRSRLMSRFSRWFGKKKKQNGMRSENKCSSGHNE